MEALSGLEGHLAIAPPSDDGDRSAAPTPTAPKPAGPAGGTRLWLAVAAAAHDGDQAATTALIREGARQGLDPGELIAVAERHWPRPRLHRRGWRAGRGWAIGWLRRLHLPRRRVSVVAEQERSR
jgi:hypothetical protein